ncbi:MAG: ABC transporter substrate-binding protein [Deltaproteobacteria bacterium]|nr:ABC transporter substrate-binding protein [Deltaproteobacteria bacterium]
MKKGFLLLLSLLFVALAFSPANASRDKDTVVLVQGVDPTTMDPHNHMETPAWNVHIQLFDTLLQRTPDIKRENLLAESHRLVNDKTWEFKVRKGVKFHNGEDLKAENFKFTFERMADPKLKLRQTVFQGVIERVEVMDDYTFRIHTKDPYPVMEAILCIYGQPLPLKYFQEKGPAHFALNPVGTGPYKFVRWIKDDHILLEANEQYFRGAPKIKRVMIRPIPEATTRVAALQTQEADIVVNIPPHLMRLMNWKGRSFVSTVPSVRVIFVAFDTTKGGPVADKRVRQAIAMGADLKTNIKKVLDGNGVVLGSPFTEKHFGYDPAIKPYEYNPEKAKQLLAEAGYAKGFDLVLNSPSGRYLNDKEMAEATAGDLRKIGINATVKTHEWGTYMNMMYGRTAAPAYLLGWGNTSFDADFTISPLMRTGKLLSAVSFPKLDELIDQGISTMDQKKRLKIYSDAAKIIREEVPWAWTYQQVDIYGVNERLNWKARTDERLVVYDMSFKK